MNLYLYLKANPGLTVVELSRRSGVSTRKLYSIRDGVEPMRNYGKALDLSKATGGECTVDDLCDPKKVKRRRFRRGE